MDASISPPVGLTPPSVAHVALAAKSTAWTLVRGGKGPLLTAVAYAIGAYIGFQLVFPPVTTSVLWPPNAILTISLLVSSPSRWWLILLTVFPVHLLVELPVVEPPSLVLLLFVTNCCEALLAASIVRYLSDRPDRFDTIQRMLAFVCGAVLAAPILSSFLDAAVVSTMTGQPYWTIWCTRVSGNALTQLTLVPPSVIFLTSGPGLLRRSPRLVTEAVVLSATIALITAAVFGGYIDRMWPIAGLPAISLAFPLPFMLLAALRFGPGGASVSLLIVAFVLIWMGMHARGPFSTLDPADGVLAVQTFLLVEALPLMCLSAIVEERRAAEDKLGERLRFERLLSQMSREFAMQPTTQLATSLEAGLASCCEFFDADELALLETAAEHREFGRACVWFRGTGVAVMDGAHWRARCPYDRIQQGSLVVLSETETAIPLKAGEQVLGALAIRRRRSDPLTPDDASRLQLIAETYANVLARKHAEEEMLRAELHARRSLAKLAFVSRQRSMGELTASLAHELNQPLTGILGNAQAARRMLAVTPPDLDEFKQILDDIVDDNRRASETIQRIKKWLQKGDLETVLLDVNKVILEVATLLKSDAVIRNLRVDLRLSECPLMVRGDAAELRQLILNLLLNAMDAVSDLDPADRVVSIVSDAFRRSRARGGAGLRCRSAERCGRPSVRAVLHDKSDWNGHGAVDFQIDRRVAPRLDLAVRHNRSRRAI